MPQSIASQRCCPSTHCPLVIDGCECGCSCSNNRFLLPSLGLWACTAECKILGHSDRCWSPSCGRANPHPSPHPPAPLSTFCKSTSLPRDPLRRDNFYQAQLPKTVGLQSVYEKVLHRDFDRTITLLSPPRPARLPDLQEIGVPLYPAPSTRFLGPQTDATEKA